MAKVERIEPTQLPNGLWLDGNEYASENVEESSGVLSLVTGETDGFRVGPELDLSAISDAGRSKLEWTASGDVEVLAAVSEVSAQGSMSFDGEDDYVDVDNAESLLVGSDKLTMMAWVYLESFDNFLPGIIGNDIGPDSVTLMSRVDDTTKEIVVHITSREQIRSNFLVSLNTWYRIVFTWNSDVGQKLYINGSLDNSRSTSVSELSSGGVLRIGDESNRGRFWDGLIGDVRLFTRDISSTEVVNDYNGIQIDNTSLVAHYPLDDPPGSTTARDISGNNNDGTIYGATYNPDNPLLQQATNGQAIPGVSSGDNLTGKKLYIQQRLSRDTTGDPSPTLTELKATVEEAVGALPLINGGLIRSAHTQNNTMIR